MASCRIWQQQKKVHCNIIQGASIWSHMMMIWQHFSHSLVTNWICHCCCLLMWHLWGSSLFFYYLEITKVSIFPVFFAITKIIDNNYHKNQISSLLLPVQYLYDDLLHIHTYIGYFHLHSCYQWEYFFLYRTNRVTKYTERVSFFFFFFLSRYLVVRLSLSYLKWIKLTNNYNVCVCITIVFIHSKKIQSDFS